MDEPRGQDLIQRYKANYNICVDAILTEEMILRHWELEKRLTREILESAPEDRWKVSEGCYSQLFGELKWLNELVGSDAEASTHSMFQCWERLIGRPPLKVYEIGSGKAGLILHLADCGFKCRGTEITCERGEKWAADHPNLSWNICDGIHFDRFEPANSYDVAISNQVIEHLHPDDVLDHFRGVLSILVDGGRYMFTTPHVSFGPSDVSKVFGCDKPMGMHLKEYTYGEMTSLLTQAGFRNVRAVFKLPGRRVFRTLQARLKPRASLLCLWYLRFLEELIAALPNQRLRRKAAGALRVVFFTPTIMIVAYKA